MHMYKKPGCVAQSVTCLATDACLTADPGVASSIPARYHTFVEIDHEIISTVILLLLLIYSRRAGFICVREMSGKFNFFQGQGIVREFYFVSVKNRYLLKCQGNVREFYNFSLYQMIRNRKLLGQFS